MEELRREKTLAEEREKYLQEEIVKANDKLREQRGEAHSMLLQMQELKEKNQKELLILKTKFELQEAKKRGEGEENNNANLLMFPEEGEAKPEEALESYHSEEEEETEKKEEEREAEER